MSKLVFLFVAFAVIGACYSLECYECSENLANPPINLPACNKADMSKSSKKVCPVDTPSFHYICSKKTYPDGHIERKCFPDKKTAPESCTNDLCLCKSNLCNSSSQVGLNAMAFVAMIVTFLACKF